MEKRFALLVALIGTVASPHSGQGQSTRRPPPRDSVLVLPRILVQSGVVAHWPDHEALQRARAVSRDSLLGELASARGRWTQFRPRMVTYRLQELCFCARTGGLPKYVTVTEQADSVIRVVNELNAPDSPLYPLAGPPSVAFLFERAEAAIRSGADDVVVTFDAVSGVPTRVFTDWRVGTTDDELDIIVSDISLLER